MVKMRSIVGPSPSRIRNLSPLIYLCELRTPLSCCGLRNEVIHVLSTYNIGVYDGCDEPPCKAKCSNIIEGCERSTGASKQG